MSPLTLTDKHQQRFTFDDTLLKNLSVYLRQVSDSDDIRHKQIQCIMYALFSEQIVSADNDELMFTLQRLDKKLQQLISERTKK